MADAARTMAGAAAAHRQPRWRIRLPAHQLALAAVFGAVLAAHLLFVWLIGGLRPVERTERDTPRIRVSLIASPMTPIYPAPRLADQHPPAAPETRRARRALRVPAPAAMSAATTPAAAEPEAVFATAPPATPPLAADRAASEPPLRLDADVMRRAALGARSDLDRRIAVDRTPHASRDQVLAARAEQAGTPSCLAPDATRHEPLPLGGLLGLPVLVHAALSGKCR